MKRLMLPYKIIFILSLIISLTGCGFHLRGAIKLPPQLHTFYLSGNSPYSSFLRQLSKVLLSSKITLVDSPDQAPLTLFVVSDKLNWSQTTVATSGALRDYSVTYSVSYVLQSSSGETLVGPNSVSSSETVTALSSELLENSSKLKQAQNNLTQSLIVKMMFQISSKNTIKKLTQVINQQKLKFKRKKTTVKT